MLQSYLALLAGGVCICLQAVGISTDFWMHSKELMTPENVTEDFFLLFGRDCQVLTKWYSGLWRICPVQEEYPEILCALPTLSEEDTLPSGGGGLPPAPALPAPPLMGHTVKINVNRPLTHGEGQGHGQGQGQGQGNKTDVTKEVPPQEFFDDYYYDENALPPAEPLPCQMIQYMTVNKRIESVDSTTSILRNMRFSTPFHILAMIMYVTAMITLLVGQLNQDKRTVIGAVLLIIAGLVSAIGVILYIQAISDELSHLAKPRNEDEVVFRYWYGWSFFFVVSAFILAEASAVAHVSTYLSRFPHIDLMSEIIPGLARKAALEIRRDRYPDEDVMVTVTL